MVLRGVGDPYLSVLTHGASGALTGSSCILIRLVLGVLIGLFSGEVRCSISSWLIRPAGSAAGEPGACGLGRSR